MLRVIRSTPDKCPDCGAENIGGQLALMFEESNTVLCNHCGVIMVIRDEEECEEDRTQGRCSDHEVSASFMVCPHCKIANGINIAGGEEWCNHCNLDPNREDYTSKNLAHLWKLGSQMRASMSRGRPGRKTKWFEFLTTKCGPHCNFANDCPQTGRNFVVCYREEYQEGPDSPWFSEEGEAVGKGRRKNRKRREERKRIRAENKLKEAAVLQCAPSGWYERNLKHRNETPNPQESTHTGGGSGT
jgi:hypothetical protein